MSFSKHLSIQWVDGMQGLFIPLYAIENAIENEIEYIDEDFDCQSVQAQIAYCIENASLDGEVSDAFVEMSEKIKEEAKEGAEGERLLQAQFNMDR